MRVVLPPLDLTNDGHANFVRSSNCTFDSSTKLAHMEREVWSVKYTERRWWRWETMEGRGGGGGSERKGWRTHKETKITCGVVWSEKCWRNSEYWWVAAKRVTTRDTFPHDKRHVSLSLKVTVSIPHHKDFTHVTQGHHLRFPLLQTKSRKDKKKKKVYCTTPYYRVLLRWRSYLWMKH